MSAPDRRTALLGLCATELVSWGILYYTVPATLPLLVAQTGWSATTIMAGFTAGLLVNAVATVPVGRLVDRHGPRWIMTTGSVLGGLALAGISTAPDPGWFAAGWVVAGFAQACLLYPPAFVSITRWYGPDRVRPLTVLSLAGGLASTVFAPLSSVLTQELGWRTAYLLLAVVLVVVTAPVHLVCLRLPWTSDDAGGGQDPAVEAAHVRRVARTPAFLALSAALCLAGVGLFSSTTNLVPLMVERGLTPSVAAAVLGLCGAGQVLGRLGFPTLTRRTRPHRRDTGILSAGTLSVGALAIVPGSFVPAVAVAMAAGASRGAMTLVQASAVADRWGTRAFGTLNGLATTPAAVAIALAPGTGTALAAWTGSYAAACWVLAGVVALGTLLAARSGVPGTLGR